MWNKQRVRRLLQTVCVLVFAVAACSGSSGTSPEDDDAGGNGNARAVGTAASPAADYDPSATSPPAVVLIRGGEELSLMAWTYCWTPEDGDQGICADGEPPEDPPVLAGDGPIELYFPVEGFAFESRFWDSAYATQRPGPSLRLVDGHWELYPPEDLPSIIEIFGFSDSNDVIISVLIES